MRDPDATVYDAAFYDLKEAGMLRSAARIVPLVMKLVEPRRVIDFGCGRGAWLRVFRECGADILGVDGDYVQREKLLIEASAFVPRDLNQIEPEFGSFDLAVCLEVAEHLWPKAGERLIRTLARSAPVVLFSAALPGQGGLEHVNEQWPWYWEELFGREGFERRDVIRPAILGDSSVEWWYRQNVVLYVRRDAVSRYRALAADAPGERLEIVNERVLRQNFGLRTVLGRRVRALRHRLAGR